VTTTVPLYLVAALAISLGTLLHAVLFWGSRSELYVPGFGYVSGGPYAYMGTVSGLATLSPIFALLSGFIHCHHQRTAKDAGLTAALMGSWAGSSS